MVDTTLPPVLDRVRVVHPVSGQEAYATKRQYRWVLYDEGWRSPDDPDWSGGGPGQGPAYMVQASQVGTPPVGELIGDNLAAQLAELDARTRAMREIDLLSTFYRPLIDDFDGAPQDGSGAPDDGVYGNPAYGWEPTAADGGTVGVAILGSVVELRTGETTGGLARLAATRYRFSGLRVFTWRFRCQRHAVSGGAVGNGTRYSVGLDPISSPPLLPVRIAADLVVPDSGPTVLTLSCDDGEDVVEDSVESPPWSPLAPVDIDIVSDGDSAISLRLNGQHMALIQPPAPAKLAFASLRPFVEVAKLDSPNSGERGLDVDYVVGLVEVAR